MTRTSWRLTWRDRTVVLLALIGGLCNVAALAAVFFAATGHVLFHRSSHAHLVAAALLAAYPLTFLVVFFDVAIAAAAGAKLEGERKTVREALRVANQRGDRIALWAVAAVAVSVLLRLVYTLPDGLGIATVPLDLLWVLATIFVVPLLALEDSSVRVALRGSRSLMRRGWGEGLTGTVAIAILAVLLMLPFFVLLLAGVASMVLLSGGGGLVVAAIGLLGIVAVRGLTGALRQVFAVALYRYAAGTSA